MYLRFRAKYYNANLDNEEFGFFKAAEYLQNFGNLDFNSDKQLNELTHWFDHQLPIPTYYQDEKNRQLAKSATSWFKDSANEYIKQMCLLENILKDNFIEVDRISSKSLVGKVIYEDDYQVTVLPYRDYSKNVV